jgi:hypothetical protein
LNEVAFALRTARSDATQFTPAFLSTGREFRTPFDNLLGIVSPHRDIQELGVRTVMIQNLARENMLSSQESSLRAYNRNAREREFHVGDLVMYRTHFLSDAAAGFCKKLAPRWEGPYQITDRVSNSVYDLRNVESNQIVNKVHANDMVIFHVARALDPVTRHQ